MVSNNALRVMQYYISKGMAPHAAAAMVGGFQAESGRDLNVRAVGDRGTSHGIYQAHKERGEFLRNYKDPAAPDELIRQASAAHSELQGPERRAGGLLARSQDLRSAARAAIAFERPSGFSWANPEGGMHFQKRLGNAQALLDAYTRGARGGTEMASVGDIQGPPAPGLLAESRDAQDASTAGLLSEGVRDPLLEYAQAKQQENQQAAQQAETQQARAAAEDARREAAAVQAQPQQVAMAPLPPQRPPLPLSFGRVDDNAPFPPRRPRGLLDDWRWA